MICKVKLNEHLDRHGDNYFGCSRRTATVSSDTLSDDAAVCGQMSGGAAVVAKQIEAHRLSLPTKPPAFDPGKLLPRLHRKVYLDPVSLAVPEDPPEDQLPKVRVRANHQQVLDLLRRLDASGRIVLATPNQVRESLLCGAFALIKDAKQDRLILDARRPNAKETTLDQWCKTLASPQTLALTEIDESHVMYFSGTDLKDYYHAFRVTKQRAYRNALADPISQKVARSLTGFKEHMTQFNKIYPCLSALAMGDNQAVEIGQLSHTVGFAS